MSVLLSLWNKYPSARPGDIYFCLARISDIVVFPEQAEPGEDEEEEQSAVHKARHHPFYGELPLVIIPSGEAAICEIAQDGIGYEFFVPNGVCRNIA